jgi:recombination DNA repair RAD52 pathway protein
LNKSLDTFENILDEKLTEITNEMKTDLLKQVKKAVEENDIKAVGAISAKYT